MRSARSRPRTAGLNRCSKALRCTRLRWVLKEIPAKFLPVAWSFHFPGLALLLSLWFVLARQFNCGTWGLTSATMAPVPHAPPRPVLRPCRYDPHRRPACTRALHAACMQNCYEGDDHQAAVCHAWHVVAPKS